MNQTQDIRPRAKGQEKKEKQQTRSAKKWRRGREQFLPVNLGSCWEDSGCSVLRFPLLLRSRIFLSFLFFPFNLSSFLCSSALFSYCRFPVFPYLPFFWFRFWGVFHRWSLRPPPLTDPVLPYLLFLICHSPFFIFVFYFL